MRRLLPSSLKGQLIALTLCALLASQLAGFYVILNDQRSAFNQEWFRNLLNRTLLMVDVLETTPADFHKRILKTGNGGAFRFSVEPKPAAPDPAAAGEAEAAEYVAEFNKIMGDRAQTGILAVYPPPTEASRFELLLEDLWRDILKNMISPKHFKPGPQQRPTAAHISLPLKGGQQWLHVNVFSRPVAPPASPLLAQLLTMGVVSALGIVFVINRATRPLKALNEAAAALGRGESSGTIPERGPREVAETVRAFNEMQERLQRFVMDRTKMLAALGHDLRTPITSLRLRAEFIDDEEIRQKIVQTLDDMLHMAEATLSFAKEDAAEESTRVVDLGALVSSVCADFADTGRIVTWNDVDGITVRCRPIGLTRALRNLVDNAIAYGKQANVRILRSSEGEVAVVIEDEGPGIPDGDMEKVFKPFVRLESSRNRQTGGVGLGLALSRSIVRNHGGDIVLQNRAEGGLRAILSLPAMPVAQLPGRLSMAKAAA